MLIVVLPLLIVLYLLLIAFTLLLTVSGSLVQVQSGPDNIESLQRFFESLYIHVSSSTDLTQYTQL